MLKAGVFVCACCRLMRSTSISCQPGRNCSRRNSCKPGVRSSSPPGGAVLLWISCMKFGGSLKRILLLSSSPYLSPFLHLLPFSILCHPFFHSTSPYSSHSPFFLSSFLPFLFTYFPTTFPCYHILTSISLHFFLPVSLFFPYPFLPAIISSFIPSLNSSLSFILPPYFLIHLLSIILMSLIHFLSKPLPPPISFVLDFLNNYQYLYLQFFFTNIILFVKCVHVYALIFKISISFTGKKRSTCARKKKQLPNWKQSKKNNNHKTDTLGC